MILFPCLPFIAFHTIHGSSAEKKRRGIAPWIQSRTLPEREEIGERDQRSLTRIRRNSYTNDTPWRSFLHVHYERTSSESITVISVPLYNSLLRYLRELNGLFLQIFTHLHPSEMRLTQSILSLSLSPSLSDHIRILTLPHRESPIHTQHCEPFVHG